MFEVNDGPNHDHQWNFRISAVQLELSEQNLEPLLVFPGINQPITSSHLKFKTNDKNQTRPIMYSLHTKPLAGRLVTMSNGTKVDITNFTQADIDSGNVQYWHRSNMDAWTQADSFEFEVFTPFAEPLQTKTFKISISYGNLNEENTKDLLRNKPLKVREGGTVMVDREHLNVNRLKRRLTQSGLQNPEVHYVLTKLPRHGESGIDL